MYKLNYDFKQYNELIAVYMESLIKNSMTLFQEQIKNGQITRIDHDSDSLAGCMQNFEEYLYYNYKKSPETFKNSLNAIINNVRQLSVLPNNRRGIYGETQTQNKVIYINPDLQSTQNLTGEERTRLYMAHELGHLVNNEWMKKVIEFANEQIRTGRLTADHAQLIYDGFSMLDEATTQNRAENFVYEFSGKNRPGLGYYRNGMFNSESFRSNFDFYGELQEPATMFARTLRGIGREDNDVRALDMLSQRALSPNFFSDILREYTRDGQMKGFINEVQYMGLLKRASYANFGYGDRSYLRNSKAYLEKLREVTSQLRDYREPLSEEHSV